VSAASGGRPRNGPVGSWADCSTGISSISSSQVETNLSPAQIWQPVPVAQPIAGRIRGVCTALCDVLCARDLQGVSSSDRIICVGTGLALQEMSISDSPILHRVVRPFLLSFLVILML
jgi:hypothetical protein